MKTLLQILPKAFFSYLTGRLACVPLPMPVAGMLIRLYSRYYSVNLGEVAEPIGSFCSLGEFFVREIKSDARPLSAGFVSPVDGVLRSCGDITGGVIRDVKQQSYDVAELVGKDFAESFRAGNFLNLYLSPRDCHHVFVPFPGILKQIDYFPGTLFPVNEWAWENISNLFPRNERVAFYFESDNGPYVIVMVGAYNVGKISSPYMSTHTNSWVGVKRRLSPSRSILKISTRLEKGARLATFHLGSSVVVLLGDNWSINKEQCDKQVVYGSCLAHPSKLQA